MPAEVSASPLVRQGEHVPSCMRINPMHVPGVHGQVISVSGMYVGIMLGQCAMAVMLDAFGAFTFSQRVRHHRHTSTTAPAPYCGAWSCARTNTESS